MPKFCIYDNGGFARETPQVMPMRYTTRKSAQRRADALNQEYGAHRYSVRAWPLL